MLDVEKPSQHCIQTEVVEVSTHHNMPKEKGKKLLLLKCSFFKYSSLQGADSNTKRLIQAKSPPDGKKVATFRSRDKKYNQDAGFTPLIWYM